MQTRIPKSRLDGTWQFCLLLGMALLLGTACSDGGHDVSPTEDTTIRDALIAQGIDLDQLFASPTAAELAAVQADWATRDVSAQNVVEEDVFSLSDGAILRIVSHTLNGERHVGAIVIPAGSHAPESLPVMMNLYGFGPPFIATIPDGDPWGFMRNFVMVVPSYRGETLQFGNHQWQSDGDLYDSCNGATDDALALLNVALATTPEADPTRIGAYGGSRGGQVGLSIAAREPRIQYLVEVAGVTDQLQLAALIHPNLVLNYEKTFARDLLAGTGTIAQARHHMLACSPRHFADQLPFVQVHHGTTDRNVPVAHAEWLIADMQRLGRTALEFEAFIYNGVDHSFDGQTELLYNRAAAYFQPLIAP